MKNVRRWSILVAFCMSMNLVSNGLGQESSAAVTSDATPPVVGDKAADFELTSVDGMVAVKLSKTIGEGPVVLVVLRGYPGYQCPICNVQVGELLKHADDFKKSGTQLLFVYPGPAMDLSTKAKEFIGKKTIPAHFTFLVDPDYAFTNAYHLRWDAPRETAYPATFVVDKGGIVRYSLVSKTHGGRAKVSDVLKAVGDIR